MRTNRTIALRALLVLLITAPASAVDGGGDRPVGDWFATRSPTLAQNGMAATSHPLASQIAIEILERGGTAVDAAIAANAALGLMEPTGCGVGGDLFAIVWDPKTKKLKKCKNAYERPQPHACFIQSVGDDLVNEGGCREQSTAGSSCTASSASCR